MSLYLQNILFLLILVNGLLYVMMWRDKAAARRQGWRVPENVLLLLTLLGGTPAMLLSRRMFRHKTKKGTFVSRLYVVILVQVAALVYFGVHGFPA